MEIARAIRLAVDDGLPMPDDVIEAYRHFESIIDEDDDGLDGDEIIDDEDTD